ncbi:hypothetical protein PR048_012537 [Dryococelus australis]|uniref:Uncharacterized protein n=1 Tax=Dryococelus australis TaxID=614101 RepID=A0ABQ9HQG6_9NEOP|nr:hypothetical protein PR048_012537 [Dryococelus australis]
MRVIEMSMEQRRNERAVETEDPEKTQFISDVGYAVQLSSKGIQVIVNASKKRGDIISGFLLATHEDPVRVRASCRIVYTNPLVIKRQLQTAFEEYEVISQACRRLIDLAAADAQYHKVCSTSFRIGQCIPQKYRCSETSASSGRPANYVQHEAFIKVAKWLETNECTPLCVNPIDILWNISKLLKEPHSRWSGFMQHGVTGDHVGTVSTRFLPMIDMNPTTYSCVYTTLKFICSEA